MNKERLHLKTLYAELKEYKRTDDTSFYLVFTTAPRSVEMITEYDKALELFEKLNKGIVI